MRFFLSNPVGLLLAGFTCVCASSSGAQPGLSTRIDSLYANYGADTPGLAIRVLLRGVVVHRGDYGMANLEHGVPVTTQTVFDLGSVSKQFTGLAVAMLADSGRLSLDADVREYVPDLPDFGAVITIRQLLHHQSGIRDWVRPFAIAGWASSDVISIDQVLEFLRCERALNFPPGTQYLYSNTGYVLLAEVVQRVTGRPFAEWMRTSVFEPLGMTHTRVRTKHYELVPHFAQSYYPVGQGYVDVRDGLTAFGASSVLTTADDFVQWLRNLSTAEVGGAAVSQMMNDVVEIHEWDRLVGYGYGLMRFRFHGHEGFFHSGQWVGFRSGMLYVPDAQLGIVVLANAGTTTNLHEWDVLDLILGKPQDAHEPASSSKSSSPSIPAGVVNAYTGTYNLGLGEVLTVERNGEGLAARFAGNREAEPLHPISETTFLLDVADTLRFERPAGKKAPAVLRNGRRGLRAESFHPSVRELDQFTGIFYCAETESVLRFVIEDGGLAARSIRWGESLPFYPTIRDEFRGQVVINQARFERDKSGNVRSVIISGDRAYRLRFRKLQDAR